MRSDECVSADNFTLQVPWMCLKQSRTQLTSIRLAVWQVPDRSYHHMKINIFDLLVVSEIWILNVMHSRVSRCSGSSCSEIPSARIFAVDQERDVQQRMLMEHCLTANCLHHRRITGPPQLIQYSNRDFAFSPMPSPSYRTGGSRSSLRVPLETNCYTHFAHNISMIQ